MVNEKKLLNNKKEMGGTVNPDKSWWLCLSCKKPLGELKDKDRIEILGIDNKRYEIGYAYIKIVCPKCGRKNQITSKSIMKFSSVHPDMSFDNNSESWEPEPNRVLDFFVKEITTPLEKSPYELSSYHRKILLKKLSETQKKVYNLLIELFPLESEEAVKEISRRLRLPPKKILDDRSIIIKGIRELR